MKKPFYKSKTVLSLVAAIVIIAVLPRLGYAVPEEYVNDVYLALVSLVVVGLRDGGTAGLSWAPGGKAAEGNGAG